MDWLADLARRRRNTWQLNHSKSNFQCKIDWLTWPAAGSFIEHFDDSKQIFQWTDHWLTDWDIICWLRFDYGIYSSGHSSALDEQSDVLWNVKTGYHHFRSDWRTNMFNICLPWNRGPPLPLPPPPAENPGLNQNSAKFPGLKPYAWLFDWRLQNQFQNSSKFSSRLHESFRIDLCW